MAKISKDCAKQLGKEYFNNSAFDFKQSEPVSADAEKAAKELYPIPFPDKFSNMNQEAIKERLAFIAGIKYQSKQPVSIQWLSEEEIDKLIEAIWNKSHLTTRKLDFIDCKKLSEFIQSQLQSRVNAVDPVDLLNWIATFESNYEGDGGYPDKIRCFDAGWFWETDRDGDCELSPKQIIEIYLASKTK